MKSPLLVSVLVAVAVVTSCAKADLIANGSFESGNAAGWTTTNLEAPFSGVFSDSFADSSSHGYILPHSGHYFASLSNDRNAMTISGHGQSAEFSQTVGTTSGQTYNLSFWADVLTSTSYPTAPGLVFQAYWNSTQLLNINNPAKTPDGWVNYNYTVTGTGSDTIAFFGANDPRYNGLDDVTLNTTATATPLPGNLTMAGSAAALGLCVCLYRRRRAIRA